MPLLAAIAVSETYAVWRKADCLAKLSSVQAKIKRLLHNSYRAIYWRILTFFSKITLNFSVKVALFLGEIRIKHFFAVDSFL